MNKQLTYGCIFIGLTLNARVGLAQPSAPFRFGAEAGVATLNLPAPYRTGALYRQQLTGYFSPRLGVALGLSWGASANRDPLRTKYVSPANPGIDLQLPDPVALRSFYQRGEQMTDLSLVYRPVLSRRHQVRIQVGLSAYRRREFGVDSIQFINPQKTNYETVARFTDTRRVVPMAAISYKLSLSSRWAVGVRGAAYGTGDGRPTTSLGLHAAYRFSVRADSLGINTITTDGFRVGVRAGTSLTTGTGGTNPGRVYRARFVGGIWAERPLSLTWAVRGEVNYAQRGYRIRETQTSTGRLVAGFGNLNYLDVPLLFRHEIAYRWYVYGGPYLSFFLNGYTETAGQRNPDLRAHTVSGLVLGTSYHLTNRLAADLRYQRDLVVLSSASYNTLQVVQAGVSYQLKPNR